MKQALHMGGRHWANVGYTCTRCLAAIKAGEKSERFRAKGGALLARHTGDCPRPRGQRVTTHDLGVYETGCVCLNCLSHRLNMAEELVSALSWTSFDQCYPYYRAARRAQRRAQRWCDNTEHITVYEEALATFAAALEEALSEGERFIPDLRERVR